MTSLWKIAVLVTCLGVIWGAAILWPVYKQKVNERKLAEGARADRLRADQGDAKAQYDLGVSYTHGQGVPRDDAEAVRWYQKAADQGYAKAQYGLATMYYYGRGVPQDYAEAVRWYRKAAEKGDAMALNVLAYMYNNGKGVPEDHAEAVRWYRKAAEQGDAAVQSYLGSIYFRGRGVPQDYAEALRWSRKAADQGDVSAQIFLGNMYRKGQGVPRDYAEAIRWYGRVAASMLARRWTSIVLILSGLAVLVLPRRLWGRATWLPWALFSAGSATRLAQQLLLPEFSLAVLIRGQPGTMFWGYGRTVWVALLAVGSAMCALCSIGEAARGSKGGGHQAEPPTPTPAGQACSALGE